MHAAFKVRVCILYRNIKDAEKEMGNNRTFVKVQF